MIARTGYVWTLPIPGGRLRGLGQMPQLTGAQYAALSPWQQQAYGNGDPNFMSATGPADTGPAYQPVVQPAPTPAYVQPAPTPAPSYPQTSSTAQQVLASLQPAVQTPTLVTIPFGTSTTTTYTLDSRMATWAAGAIAMPSSLAGADPMSEAVAVAQNYCAQQAMPDCANLSAIASKYGSMVAQALTSEPALVQAVNQPNTTGAPAPSPAPGTTSASQPTSVNAASPPSYTAPVVVNPSPPSQPVTDGSNTTSPASTSNVANGSSMATSSTTSTDIIPGIDNSVLFIGAGAAVLVFMLVMRK